MCVAYVVAVNVHIAVALLRLTRTGRDAVDTAPASVAHEVDAVLLDGVTHHLDVAAQVVQAHEPGGDARRPGTPTPTCAIVRYCWRRLTSWASSRVETFPTAIAAGQAASLGSIRPLCVRLHLKMGGMAREDARQQLLIAEQLRPLTEERSL